MEAIEHILRIQAINKSIKKTISVSSWQYKSHKNTVKSQELELKWTVFDDEPSIGMLPQEKCGFLGGNVVYDPDHKTHDLGNINLSRGTGTE